MAIDDDRSGTTALKTPSRQRTMIIVGVCGMCGADSHLTVIDTELTSPELARGAAWTCPRCDASNRIPIVAKITSVIAVNHTAD